MRLLLDRGAEVNKVGSRAMIWGVENGEGEHDKEVSDITKFLLDLGVDPNGRNQHGWTALLGAAHLGYPSAVRLLLDRGADVNATCDCPNTGYGGSTALMLAAHGGHLESVEALLGKGADVNQSNERGETALTRADNPRIVQLLKESRAQ